MKILVVDDDSISVRLTSKILGKKGYPTLCASSAQEAIALMDAGEPIGLILSDMRMPDMDGLQFLECLRNRPGFMDIPVIMCSAERGRDVVMKTIQKGARDYIVKPLDAGVLIEKVEDVLRAEVKPLIDKDLMVNRLKIDPEDYDEMMTVLIQRITEAVKEMQDLIQKGSHETLQLMAGGLCSGAVSLGADRLNRVLSRLETTISSGDPDKMKDMVMALQRELNILKEALSPPDNPHRV
jgi:CheY-like chemotaxis protein